MNPTSPPPTPLPPPQGDPPPPRVTRATVVLVAVGMLLVAALAVGIVSIGQWGWTALRMQARTSPHDTAAATPPVMGQPAPASAGATTSPPVPPASAPVPAAPPSAVAPPAAERTTSVPLLRMPVDGVAPTDLYPSFDEARGTRRHEAIDIMAPRGTPVRAAVDGAVVKLFTSDAGGLTVYQFDRDERLAYYYAHLDRYADGLREGRVLSRGDVLGYVGSTGNASADAPHLHFAIFELGPEKRWWEGRPIDPYPLLGGGS